MILGNIVGLSASTYNNNFLSLMVACASVLRSVNNLPLEFFLASKSLQSLALCAEEALGAYRSRDRRHFRYASSESMSKDKVTRLECSG